MPVRLAALAIGGIVGGAFANYLIYTGCYFPRPISPWADPDKEAPPRKATDRVPLLGWLGLRREASIHGRGFWIRPILIEVAMAIGLPLLYWHETQSVGILPAAFATAAGAFEPWATQIFFGHVLLVTLMVAATFIDFDETTIPDVITVPGTIIALIMMSCSLKWLLPAVGGPAGAPLLVHVTYEFPWPPADPKWQGTTGLWLGLGIWSGWCFALANRRVILRHGVAKAVEYFMAGLTRRYNWQLLLGIWLVGFFAIIGVHKWGGTHWEGLFTSLVGLAVGGGVVWAIRIVASLAMNAEAMGFGDVTLMAMVGAFCGWQTAVLAFALAPFTAIAIVIVQFVLTRNRSVPFGPYLCAGTLLTIIYWDEVYLGWFSRNFNLLGPIVLPGAAAMLGLMGVMLFISRMVKQVLRGSA